MENQYTVQNLEYAVSVFYNSEHNERAQAHQWLTTAQRCPEAWSFVWELLQPTKPTEVQFFAATTLHTKLLRCWGEVPEESHEELKNKILHAVLSYAKGPKIVLNRLCISLAAFILQQASTDLVSILSPLSAAEHRPLLLEVLTVIPEEFNSMTMLSPLRVKNRIILQKACPAVLDDMLQCLQSVYSKEPPSEETIQWWWLAALCCGSWLTLGADEASPERGISVDLAQRLPLVNALFSVVQQLYTHHEVISDSALEACEAALSAVRAAGAAPDAARSPGAALQLLSELAALAAPILARDNVPNSINEDAARSPGVALQLLSELAALAAPILARDNVPNSINEELLSAIATCAVSLTECHSRAIVTAIEREGHSGALQTLELLLASQAAPGHYPIHETRSHLVTAVWYTVQDEILCLSPSPGAAWRGLFSRLLRALLTKSEAPAEQLARDDAELLRCYRQDLADTAMYCFGVLGDYSFTIIEAAWREATTDCRREACLHILLALGDTTPQSKAPGDLIVMLEHAVNTAASCEDKELCNTALHCLVMSI
ncbi:hypothetical protein JYU34_016505 [Plutella xylostella]|uniref:Importin N-terminal domain-containing protein n=1 Tax=Plutella xylostella TaxID=51655 RepID=A0ABQ7Q335_PLUXY|nr:hypothetical protein JYU34_016505 [Plutella xylostella]